MLKFLGRGSAFMDENNSAYFVANNELILLDCPISAFVKLKKKDLKSYDHIYVLITHTHGDHAGGTAMLIDYNYFLTGTPVTVVAPSKEVLDDLNYLFRNIEGCGRSWYELIEGKDLNKDWYVTSIPTTHSEELKGKCFGYCLDINGTRVVYTGDTNTLDPYIPYLTEGSYLYTEVTYYDSPVHIRCEKYKAQIADIVKKGIKVYLMHLDEEEKILEIMRGTGAEPAPLD